MEELMGVLFQLPNWFSVLYTGQGCVSSFTYLTHLKTMGEYCESIDFRCLIQCSKQDTLASYSHEACIWEIQKYSYNLE